MASTPFLIIIMLTFISLLVFVVSAQNFPSSTISAAPATLPSSAASPPLMSSSSSPSPSAALSPDITPLFPSPSGNLSPSESSLPLIPSSPSPPNPDALEAPGPAAFSPFQPLPDSSSVRLADAAAMVAAAAVIGGAWVMTTALV
ncbi:classical arabinogalactan protein 26 [Andrographis paniculata]|uniref:classical arabinogalactan protein 26 n=1 Tax=Andrographis paniculata TaxID=175694 RepID=UPI0021E6D799|nr:classical arabinogalactan protein 26 [Andrographis paniculata]